MKTLFRLTGLVKPYFFWMALAALIGFATTGSETSGYITAIAIKFGAVIDKNCIDFL